MSNKICPILSAASYIYTCKEGKYMWYDNYTGTCAVLLIAVKKERE